MISVPKGVLRLAALKLLSESGLSGTGLASEVERISEGEWRPGPGSIYLVLSELLKKGLINELPKREGNVRRYIISSRGKEELSRLSKEAEGDVSRQLKVLSIYLSLTGRKELQQKVQSLSGSLSEKD